MHKLQNVPSVSHHLDENIKARWSRASVSQKKNEAYGLRGLP
jgi:hypothetical protein